MATVFHDRYVVLRRREQDERTFVHRRQTFRTAPRSRSASRALSLAHAKVFGLILIATYVASSLSGQILLEWARKEGIWAAERYREARIVEAQLRREVETFAGLAELDLWTSDQGLLPPELALSANLVRGNGEGTQK